MTESDAIYLALQAKETEKMRRRKFMRYALPDLSQHEMQTVACILREQNRYNGSDLEESGGCGEGSF